MSSFNYRLLWVAAAVLVVMLIAVCKRPDWLHQPLSVLIGAGLIALTITLMSAVVEGVVRAFLWLAGGGHVETVSRRILNVASAFAFLWGAVSLMVWRYHVDSTLSESHEGIAVVVQYIACAAFFVAMQCIHRSRTAMPPPPDEHTTHLGCC